MAVCRSLLTTSVDLDRWDVSGKIRNYFDVSFFFWCTDLNEPCFFLKRYICMYNNIYIFSNVACFTIAIYLFSYNKLLKNTFSSKWIPRANSY